MAFSTNTNIAALQAQEYLRVNSDFQQKTIGRVTSGLRITASGDDAAGLAIANGFRSDQAVLTQGIRNANDGLSQLQIIDGGINNISKLLDRARTLATQSASGTFTGSRTVLNSEFQSVLGEIDRQAQAIGLNTSGEFAKSLSVFIGGGKASGGITQISNGAVAVDLSASTVDTKSLGLKGVQAKGVDGTDIGTGSATTSLAQILGNATNSASLATANKSRFTLRGPGFSGEGVNIDVNTNAVGSTADLVTNINNAIDVAGAVGTQSATALKNAGIRASIVTDSSGRQQLAFNSSTTAFQVEAGDRTANALLGKYERNASLTGSDTGVGVNTNTATSLQVAIDGGSAITVSFTDNGAGGTTSKGSIVAQLNANSTFAAAASAYLEGNQVVIKSKGNSASSSVAITGGTLATRLGLSTTTATAAAASTGADVNTRVQGNRAVSGGANVTGTDASATLNITNVTNNLDLTVGGTNAVLSLTTGTGLTKAQIAADINTQIAASALANKLTATVEANNKITLTALNAGDSVTVNTPGTNPNVNLGFTAGTSTSNTFQTSDTIKFRFQGGGLNSPVDVTLDAATAGSTTVSSVLTDLVSKVTNNSSLLAAGISLTTAVAGNNLVFKSSNGESFQVSVTGDTQNKLGFGSFQAGSGASFDYTTITAGSAFAGTFDPANTSQQGTLQFSLNGAASSGNAVTVTQLSDRGQVTGTAAVGAAAITLATTSLYLVVDGTAAAAITLTSGNTISQLAGEINTAAVGVTADVVGSGASSTLRIRSNTTGTSSSVVVTTGAGSVTLSDLGLTLGQVGVGSSAATIRQDVADQINTAIAADSDLRNAGLQASFDGSNQLVVASNNATSFRLTAFGNTDLGFGKAGGSYSGPLAQGASATSATVNAAGANATTALTYSDLAFGGDDQAVTITASDSSGAKQSLSVTLRNDAGGRNARSIDDAVKAINDSLQQSNNATLKQIVAVKENTGGAEKIRFLSTVGGFEVGVGSTPGATGFTQPTGGIDKSAVVGSGANSAIDTQSAAENAVSALSAAVSALGNAQAVVGRGQNQLNFAVNLASSQLTNLAASESRIRDADLAAEAANLTKAQIVSQAGVAALAQANSAPQAVLALLRG